jgi:hypothetical protein
MTVRVSELAASIHPRASKSSLPAASEKPTSRVSEGPAWSTGNDFGSQEASGSLIQSPQVLVVDPVPRKAQGFI